MERIGRTTTQLIAPEPSPLFLHSFPRLLATKVVSAILIDHDMREVKDWLEGQDMQSEEHTHNVSTEVGAIAEPLPHHADAEPLGQTSPPVSRRRLTTRELSRRRRQRLLELLQQQAKPSVRS